MSTPPSALPTAASLTNFQSILHASLKAYEKHTKKDLLAHPLAVQLHSCDSAAAILAVLNGQVQEFGQSRSLDGRLTKWLDPTVNVLLAFSEALGEGVSLVNISERLVYARSNSYPQVFSPAKVIFAGAGVLLSVSAFPVTATIIIAPRSDIVGSQAAKDVMESQGTLADVFERIENFFKRLETYTEVPPTAAMTDIIVKIMVEVLNVFAILTKEIQQGRTSTSESVAAGYLILFSSFLREVSQEAGWENRPGGCAQAS
jgi:hypothetical protein